MFREQILRWGVCAHPHPYPSTATPAPLPPSPGPWESSPSAEGSWPKGWGPALPHNRAIQPGGCQLCSACCPQDRLVRGSSAPGEWRGQIRDAGPGRLDPCSSPAPHPAPLPSLSLARWMGTSDLLLPLTHKQQINTCEVNERMI